jgi:hypothetical protein
MAKLQTEYPQDAVILEGQYPATLKECTEYEKNYGDGPVPKVAWIFGVQADEEAVDDDVELGEDVEIPSDYVFEIAAHTSLATGPNSNFAKLNLPAWVGSDWDGDTDGLLGKKALVDVDQFTRSSDGKTQNVISKIREPRKSRRGRKSKDEELEAAKDDEGGENKEPEVEVDESDFEDIPM